MTREILFRGKTAKGEWVYGAYYKQEHFYGDEKEVHCIITTKDVLSNDLGLDYEEVLPETVGQYVGIKDKNGKKVYEGDIVKVRITQTEDKQTYGDCKYKIGVIVYNENFALFTCKNNFMNFINWAFNDYEVIGNIFDKESDNGD